MNYSQQSSIQYRESSYLRAYKALYLRAYKALHLSRILYKSALFMQNKPNFRKAIMNLSCFYTKDYKNFIPLAGQKTNPIKPNSNPIQTQFKPNLRNAQNECKYLLYKGIQQ